MRLTECGVGPARRRALTDAVRALLWAERYRLNHAWTCLLTSPQPSSSAGSTTLTGGWRSSLMPADRQEAPVHEPRDDDGATDEAEDIAGSPEEDELERVHRSVRVGCPRGPARPDADGGGEDVRAPPRSTGWSAWRQARGREGVRESERISKGPTGAEAGTWHRPSGSLGQRCDVMAPRALRSRRCRMATPATWWGSAVAARRRSRPRRPRRCWWCARPEASSDGNEATGPLHSPGDEDVVSHRGAATP
jgi:hypothetical protein